MRTVAIIQARMGSSRFPGKMLAGLGGRPLLEWVLERVRRTEGLDGVVLATSSHPRDDGLDELAGKLGVEVFRGDEEDVLGRFVQAAKQTSADVIVRVCADNPFVAPEELQRLIRFFSDEALDYACNHMDRLGSKYADGFGAEILRRNVLEEVSGKARDPRHREHVTLYLWDHPGQYRLGVVSAPPELAHPEWRFDVDSPDDLEFLERLVATGVSLQSPAADIIRQAIAASEATGNPQEQKRAADGRG